MNKQKTLFNFIFLIVVALFLVDALPIDGRPGGGSSFSSGGSSSSGGGGDGIPIEAIPYVVFFILTVSFTSASFSTLRGKVLTKKSIGKDLKSMLLGGAAYYAQVAMRAQNETLGFGARFIRAVPMLGMGFPFGFFIIAIVGPTQSAAIIYDIIAGGALALLYFMNRDKSADQDMVTSGADMGISPKSRMQVEKGIENLKDKDPGFSKVLFLDFVSSVYHKYYAFQGKKHLKDLKPFLSEEVEGELAHELEKGNVSHTEIVIGAMHVIDVLDLPNLDGIAVDIEANYTKNLGNKSTRFIVQERWLFNRNKQVASVTPEKLHQLSCPNCGAPANFTDNGQCNYCNTQINLGEMQWYVKKRAVIRRETFQVKGLGTYAEERGTDLPTIYQPTIEKWKAQFALNHQLDSFEHYWPSFQENVVHKFFMAIYDAWTRQQWMDVRHLVSDRLFESNNFWIEEYKKQGLINKLANIQIQQVQLARIDLDQYYESFTVRIFASSLDYVTDANGKLIGGSNKKPRRFSEYWTFIRRTGVEKPESEYDLTSCPSCGASTDKMGQAAECGYCGSKISTGEFYWVLAIITQDEVYRG
ncbi:MAG: TIM44-like domain-containing protein [Flammeovirgaceae bacterium]